MKKNQATGDTRLKHLINILTASKPLFIAYGLEPLLNTWEQLYIAVYKPYFSIGITGESGRGKSTVINQLLGKDLVPTGTFPGTALLTRISYGSTAQLTCPQAAEPGTLLEVSARSWEKIMAASEGYVIDVNLKTPHPWLKKFNCELLDMPGTDNYTQKTGSLLPECDALLITVSATMALSQTELDFIEQWVLPLNIPRIAILITRLDQLPAKDQETLVHYILKTLENLRWDIPVYLTSGDKNLTGGEFAGSYGIAAVRQAAESWMTSQTHARLRFESLRAQVQLLLTQLITELETRRQQAQSVNQASQLAIEEAVAEITQLRLYWEQLRLEMEKRLACCERLLNDLLSQGRKDVLEQANVAISRTTLPKEFAEKELPLMLERQIRLIVKTAEATIQQQIAADGLWLKEKVADAFLREIHINRPERQPGSGDPSLNLNTRKYEDLQRSRQISRIFTGLATIGVYLLAGPLGIVISIGGGFISDAVIAGKIGQQREMLAKTIQDQVYKIFDDAIQTGTALITSHYRAAIQSTAEQETAWADLQGAYLRQQQDSHAENTGKLETDLSQATHLLTILLKQENLIS
ncbi:dynamin family protein [Mucilaginibacter angelicae]|uniref:Dynamin family protein n=1 Tax=Mucilaginibacter angelicae TaxID=869718 RepID=A0ABV6LHH4_9SPHI